METAPDVNLSPSERRTLQHVVEGELHTTELDWVALQHLRTLGLAEERRRMGDLKTGPAQAGRVMIQAL